MGYAGFMPPPVDIRRKQKNLLYAGFLYLKKPIWASLVVAITLSNSLPITYSFKPSAGTVLYKSFNASVNRCGSGVMYVSVISSLTWPIAI